jgi:hypothetical protein
MFFITVSGDEEANDDDDSIEVIPESENDMDTDAPNTFYVEQDSDTNDSIPSSVKSESEDFTSFEIISEEDTDKVLGEDAPASTSATRICSQQDFDLAIKVAFNYDAASNAYQIMQSFEKEAIPTKMATLNGTMEIWENG